MRQLLLLIMMTLTSCVAKKNDLSNLEKLFTREAKAGKNIQTIDFDNELLRLTIPSYNKITRVDANNVTGVAFNIGGKTDVYCYVQSLSLPGTNISTIIDKVTSSDNIETIVEPFTEVAIYNSTPVIFLGTFYRTTDKLLGDFKLAHIMLDDHSINCTHDEPGYRKSFRTAIQSIASTVQEKLKTHRILKKQVYLVSFGPVKAGFVLELEAQNDEEHFFVNYQSIALPVSETSLKTYDSQIINFVDDKSMIIKNISLAYENADLDYQLSYDRLEKSKYQFQGVHKGTLINRVVSTDSPIMREEDKIKEYLKKGVREFEILVYQPYSSPKSFSKAKVKMNPSMKEGTFITDDVSMTFYLDKNLDLSKQVIHEENYDLIIERVRNESPDNDQAIGPVRNIMPGVAG